MVLYNRLLNDFKTIFMANSILGIIVSSCLGSIAAMLILMQGLSTINIVHLSWIVIVCMIYNASVLATLSAKSVFALQVISVSSSFLTIFYYILF